LRYLKSALFIKGVFGASFSILCSKQPFLRMKVFFLCAAAALMATLSSCSITLPVAATSNPVGAKVGSATADVFLSVLVFGGDASIRSAAKNGGITRISTVDLKQTNILGLYGTYTAIVTGE
jgi:hypothetical protein